MPHLFGVRFCGSPDLDAVTGFSHLPVGELRHRAQRRLQAQFIVNAPGTVSIGFMTPDSPRVVLERHLEA